MSDLEPEPLPEEPENVTSSSDFPFRKQNGEYVCDICGKTFGKFSSLRSHVLRSSKGEHEGHPLSNKCLVENDDGSISVKSDAKPKKPKPRKHLETADRGASPSTPSPRSQSQEIVKRFDEKEDDVQVSNEADQLRSILHQSRFKNVEMVVRLCDLYGYDVKSVHRALREVSAPRSVMRPVLSWLSEYNGEELPDDIARQLGISTQPDYFDREPEERDEVDVKIDQALDRAGKVDLLNRLSPNRQQSDGRDREVIEDLRSEVKDLRGDLKRSEEKRVDDKLEALNKKIEEMGKSRTSEIGELTGLVHDLGTSYMRLWGNMMGVSPNQPAPEREKALPDDPNSVFQLVPDEFREN